MKSVEAGVGIEPAYTDLQCYPVEKVSEYQCPKNLCRVFRLFQGTNLSHPKQQYRKTFYEQHTTHARAVENVAVD
jgi:hypothetical protein